MSARKIEQDPPHIAAARARLMDEVCAALPPEAVYRQSPPMTDTPGTLEERLRRNSGWRNERHQCVTDPNLLTEAADEIASLRARVEAMESERKTVLQNERVNDAIQTALERGELHVTLDGYLKETKNER